MTGDRAGFRSGRTALIADWVVPVSAPPIPFGAVVIEDGLIKAVTTERAIESGEVHADKVQRFRDAILAPGLVNVHSHLELTSLRGFLEGLGFGAWLRILTELRSRVLTPNEILTASLSGVREGMLAGITTYGDAAATGIPLRAMTTAGVRGIVYQEVFGPDPSQSAASMARLRDDVARLKVDCNERVQLGVSPHAPYTVSQQLFEAVADFALSDGLPVSVHIAESRAESEFVQQWRGHFAKGLRLRGIGEASLHRSPVELLNATGILAAKPLLVHAIHIDPQDAALIAEHGATVAHCPVSNARLAQGMSPIALLANAGIAIGLGSDSVASNNRMDILAEAQQAVLVAAVHPDHPLGLTAHDALTMATLGGARALGLESDIGSLEVGKAADIAAFDAQSGRYGPVFDPEVTLVHTLAGCPHVRLLLIDGNAVVYEGETTNLDAAELRSGMRTIADKLKAWRN